MSGHGEVEESSKSQFCCLETNEVNEVNERTNERTNERKAVVVCTFVRSFLPSFVRSFVRSFARCGRRFWISDKVAVCRLRSAVCRLPFAVCGLCVVGCSAVAVLWLCGCHAVNCRASFIQSSLRSPTCDTALEMNFLFYFMAISPFRVNRNL